jgi:hypothetical protein
VRKKPTIISQVTAVNEAHTGKNIRFENNYILLTVDDKNYKIDVSNFSKKLASSPDSVKNNYILSPSGYGIHWPDIDEDLSIDGLNC